MGPLREAMRRVAARPRLVAAVVGLHVAVALLASGPFSATLAPILDGRPAAAEMLRGDDGLAGELLEDHPEILRVAGASAQSSALLYGLLSWILVGGLLAALGGDGETEARGPVAVASACARHASRMVRVGLISLPLRLAPIALGAGAWLAAAALVKDRGFAQLALAYGAAALVFGGAWSLVTVAGDYARGLAFADGALAPWRAVGRGVKLALARRAQTARLAAFSGLGFALPTALYLAIALALPNPPFWSLAVLTLLRLALAAARAFFTIVTLTASARVATR